MKHDDGAIARAIAELEDERTHVTVRLHKIEDAIAMLRELFHLPDVRKHVNGTVLPKRRGRPPRTSPDDPEHAARLLARIDACDGPPAQTLDGQLHRRVRRPSLDDNLDVVWSGGEGLSACGSVGSKGNA